MKYLTSISLLSAITLASAKQVSEQTNKYCNGCNVVSVQNNINWGFEDGQWCEISADCINEDEKECTSYPLYPCCSSCEVVAKTDEGSWGVENGQWCGIKNNCSVAAVEDSDDSDDVDADVDADVDGEEDSNAEEN
eukprot:jgi/Orpsp1_1/1175333/evm.model.c7180000053433.1